MSNYKAYRRAAGWLDHVINALYEYAMRLEYRRDVMLEKADDLELDDLRSQLEANDESYRVAELRKVQADLDLSAERDRHAEEKARIEARAYDITGGSIPLL